MSSDIAARDRAERTLNIADVHRVEHRVIGRVRKRHYETRNRRRVRVFRTIAIRTRKEMRSASGADATRSFIARDPQREASSMDDARAERPGTGGGWSMRGLP
jgi:hypothetical protein